MGRGNEMVVLMQEWVEILSKANQRQHLVGSGVEQKQVEELLLEAYQTQRLVGLEVRHD